MCSSISSIPYIHATSKHSFRFLHSFPRISGSFLCSASLSIPYILLGSCTASPESLEAFCVLPPYPFPTSCDAVIPLPDMESLEALRV